MTKTKQINSLAFKQAKTVFLVSVILGICFSCYQAIVDLHSEQQRIEESYHFKLMQSYTNASLAAYHLNSILAGQVATSLMSDPAIHKVEIIDDFGDTLIVKERPLVEMGGFVALLSDYFTPHSPTFSTDLHQPESNVLVGKLSFSVDGSFLATGFINKTTQVLLFDLLRNILLTCILLMFFYRKLSRPIILLNNWVRSLSEKEHATPPPIAEKQDEISELAFNFHKLWKEHEKAEMKLNQLAYYDSLTGLANRSLLLNKLSEAIELANKTHSTGVFFYIDVDRFKTINDSLGHHIGDSLIRAIALRMESWAKEGYIVARIGGDEFAILNPSVNVNDIDEAAQQLISLLSNPYAINGHQLYSTVSLGISTFPENITSNIDVLRQADTALYRAKGGGRNNYVFYKPEMQAQIESFLTVEKGLHEALLDNQLELYYQPQVDAEHNIVGVEALIRWNHPDRGQLPPGVFMPIAEETGQILMIGKWIVEQACHQYAEWKNSGVLPSHFRRLAVNISPLQFGQANFVDFINDTLKQAGISGEHIELEITEGLLLENVDSSIEKMEQLKLSGISISIDDFGTGYSSLRYLKHLSVDMLKIDRSFVTQLHLDESDQAIVDTIVIIAKRLKLEVIAEGVESLSELNALKALGCEQFQGYLFDKPLPVHEVVSRFKNNPYQSIDTNSNAIRLGQAH